MSVAERLLRVADRYDAIGLPRCAVLPRDMAKSAGDYPELYGNFCDQLEAHVTEKEKAK